MTVVLLHALARTRRSMKPLATALARAGHRVEVIDYPSTRATLPELARGVVGELRSRAIPLDESTSFVGHSMGGLVYRALASVVPGLRTGPSVTLGTPHVGSVVARALATTAVARAIYGPAFPTIDPAQSDLLPLPGPTLTIAGTRASSLVPARWVLRMLGETRDSDSTVLVDEALAPDAHAHARVDASHTFLPSRPEVHRLCVDFLADPTLLGGTNPTRPIIGVFVGGASSRMGSPKGRLKGPDGRALLVRLVEVASRLGDVVLVGNAAPYADLLPDLPRVTDAGSSAGPLGGLVALVDMAGRRNVLALACDLPFVDEASLRELLASPSASPIVAMRAGPDAPYEPLFARYSARALPALRAALANGTTSLQRVLAGVRADALTPRDPRSIRDWDTPDDVARDTGSYPTDD